ncbi:MAG: RtcB family protein [Planctomycetes bacterium]|nr:RtcB family protein [Planctomycetota bacterium]MBI3843330.1 RtcB family protein [Planctomycetota bacterium]
MSVTKSWLAGPLPREVAGPLERLAAADDVRHVAVMPDVHHSDDVCVGVVVATRRLLYPAAVGQDIGCGMAALAFDGDADAIANERAAARVLAGFASAVPAMRHGRATMRERLPDSLFARPSSDPRIEKLKSRDGRVEFATLGRGNHFLELSRDDEGRLWLVIHSGSRAMGRAIHDHFVSRAVGRSSGIALLDAESEPGSAYLGDLAWAIDYADESRTAMADAAATVLEQTLGLRRDASSFVRCLHNHVRRESHFGESLWVHRKGTISADAGEPGIIPGSMGTATFLVEGRGDVDSLRSSSHGAGRAMSRTDARRRISLRDLERQMKGVWFDRRLASRLRDEAPSAYKDIGGVMRAQRDLTRIVTRLRPVLSYKAV